MSRYWLVWFIVFVIGPAPMAAETMSPTAAKALADSQQLTIVDIRRPEEWAATGIPAGALTIPLQDRTLALREGFVEDLIRTVEGDYDRPIALICAAGVRSAFAQQLLFQQGFSAVHNIGEGMGGSDLGPGWLARGLPVEPFPPRHAAGLNRLP